MKIAPKRLMAVLGLLTLSVMIIACEVRHSKSLAPGSISTNSSSINELIAALPGHADSTGTRNLVGRKTLALAQPGEDVWIIVKPPAQPRHGSIRRRQPPRQRRDARDHTHRTQRHAQHPTARTPRPTRRARPRPPAPEAHRRRRLRRRLYRVGPRHPAVPQPLRQKNRGGLPVPAAPGRGGERVRHDRRAAGRPAPHPGDRAREGRGRGAVRPGPGTGAQRVAADPGAAQHLRAESRQHRAGPADRYRHHLLQYPRLRRRLVHLRLPDGRGAAFQPALHPSPHPSFRGSSPGQCCAAWQHTDRVWHRHRLPPPG